MLSATVLQGLNDLKNPNPKTIEVTREELIAYLKKQGSPDWEINMTLSFLGQDVVLGGPNGERIVLKKE